VSQPPRRLLFAGEAIVDLLMWVPALPERGGDMLSESAAIEVGGGFNIMAAAVRQGLPVVYAGRYAACRSNLPVRQRAGRIQRK